MISCKKSRMPVNASSIISRVMICTQANTTRTHKPRLKLVANGGRGLGVGQGTGPRNVGFFVVHSIDGDSEKLVRVSDGERLSVSKSLSAKADLVSVFVTECSDLGLLHLAAHHVQLRSELLAMVTLGKRLPLLDFHMPKLFLPPGSKGALFYVTGYDSAELEVCKYS